MISIGEGGVGRRAFVVSGAGEDVWGFVYRKDAFFADNG